MCATFDSKPSLVSPEGTFEWQSLLFLYPMKTQFGNGSKLYPPKKWMASDLQIIFYTWKLKVSEVQTISHTQKWMFNLCLKNMSKSLCFNTQHQYPTSIPNINNPRMRSDRACAGTLGSHGHCSAVDGDWMLIWGYHGLIWGYHQDRTGHHGIHNQDLFSVLVWFIWTFTGFQLVNYCKPPVVRRFNHQVQGFNWLRR